MTWHLIRHSVEENPSLWVKALFSLSCVVSNSLVLFPSCLLPQRLDLQMLAFHWILFWMGWWSELSKVLKDTLPRKQYNFISPQIIYLLWVNMKKESLTLPFLCISYLKVGLEVRYVPGSRNSVYEQGKLSFQARKCICWFTCLLFLFY